MIKHEPKFTVSRNNGHRIYTCSICGESFDTYYKMWALKEHKTFMEANTIEKRIEFITNSSK